MVAIFGSADEDPAQQPFAVEPTVDKFPFQIRLANLYARTDNSRLEQFGQTATGQKFEFGLDIGLIGKPALSRFQKQELLVDHRLQVLDLGVMAALGIFLATREIPDKYFIIGAGQLYFTHLGDHCRFIATPDQGD
ncbi:MAG TPA: hypothetical protein EYG11_22120 [Candidatus Latescibacteria bacterium]|nr:hypothetical protein [Candidatus Latescibacterota bacterium]